MKKGASEKISKFFYNVFFTPLLYIFSYIVPKNKDLTVLGSGFGYKFMGSPKYFFLYSNKVKKDKTRKFIWITRNKDILKCLKKEKLPVLYLYSFQAFNALLRTRFLIVEQSAQDVTGTVFLLGRYKIINTWHGTPIKKVSTDVGIEVPPWLNVIFKSGIKIEQKKYLMLSSSPETTKNFKKVFPAKSFIKVGYPRDDVLFKKNLAYNNYEKRLKLYKFKKVFLYAPTYRDDTVLSLPFSENFIKELDALFKKENWLLLIRAHPLSNDIFDIKKFNNILDVSVGIDDVQELLVCMDVLIADYSSIFFDFFLTGRPIIFYPFDYKEYIMNSRKMFFDYFKELPGPFAVNERQLLRLIKTMDTWSKDKSYLKKYDKFNLKFHTYTDGNSSERLYNFLRGFI